MKQMRQFPSWFSKQNLSGKLAIGCAGLFLLCCLCSVPIVMFSPSTPSPTANNTSVANIEPASSPTPVNVATVVPTNTDVPILTPSPTDFPALIPNIWQTDVTTNLQRRFGMTCSEVEKGVLYYSHTCQKGFSLIAIVYGRSVLGVDFITASYADPNPSIDVAIAYLSYVATAPFIGNDTLQKQASEWVKTNLPTIGADYTEIETDIAGIHFKIRGKREFVTLEIGELR